MPQPLIKKVAKEQGISESKAEEFWERAKTIVDDQYGESHKGYWAIVTKIFQNIAKAN